MSMASKLVPQMSKTVSIHMPATRVAYQHAYRVPAKPRRYRLASHRSGYPPDLYYCCITRRLCGCLSHADISPVNK